MHLVCVSGGWTYLDIGKVHSVEVGEHLTDLGGVLQHGPGGLGEVVEGGVATEGLGEGHYRADLWGRGREGQGEGERGRVEGGRKKVGRKRTEKMIPLYRNISKYGENLSDYTIS